MTQRISHPARLSWLAVLGALGAIGAGGCHSGHASNQHVIQVTIEDGQLVLTDSIGFDQDSSELAPGSSEILDVVASVLSTHSGITAIRIEGHTDMHGTDDHNAILSTERADVVAAYLREHGVTQPITTAGFGATRHVCAETTEECDARNRRVEFFVGAE
jgi:outer membrane protein OmpA-like peptidoglycan-associated protein